MNDRRVPHQFTEGGAHSRSSEEPQTYILALEGQELCALSMALQMVSENAPPETLDVLRALAPIFWNKFGPIHEHAHACEPDLAERVHTIVEDPDTELNRLERRRAVDDLLASVGSKMH